MVRGAQAKSLQDISNECKTLTEKAKTGKLLPDDYPNMNGSYEEYPIDTSRLRRVAELRLRVDLSRGTVIATIE